MHFVLFFLLCRSMTFLSFPLISPLFIFNEIELIFPSKYVCTTSSCTSGWAWCVVIRGTKPSRWPVAIGVPQGSVLVSALYLWRHIY